MSTVRDLVTAALLDLGAIADGEVPSATEAAGALRRLNLMLELWHLEALMIYAIDTVSLALTGATSYTWGSGGTINTTRPVRLEHAVQRQGSGATALDFPLQVLTDVEYEDIHLKGLQSTYARWVYLDRAYPLASLFPWPVPPSGDTLLLYPWHPLTAFASLDTTIALPPGYELALQTNLSIELAPSYRDCTVTPDLRTTAVTSKALIKTINTRERLLTLPGGLPMPRWAGATSRSAFNSGGNV